MGQKVNPIGMRLGIIRDWDSRWYARKAIYREWVLEDARVRRLLRERFAGDSSGRGGSGRGGSGRGGSGRGGSGRGGSGRGGPRSRNRDAGISRIEIERAPNMLKLTLHTARPGIIIGRGGRGVEDIRADIERVVKSKVHINVQEIRQAELDANLVAENVASQLERRIAFKRTVRQALQRSMRMGAKGIRVLLSGRLGGGEMSRRYGDRDGKIPLHTFRADIDYGFTEARTATGNIGVKVWIYRGDVLPEASRSETRPVRPAATADKPRKGWRRVGAARRVEAQPEEQPAATAETEETPSAAQEATAASAAQEATDVSAAQEATDASAGPPEQAQPSVGAESEEQKNDVDAVQDQISETPQGPQTGQG